MLITSSIPFSSSIAKAHRCTFSAIHTPLTGRVDEAALLRGNRLKIGPSCKDYVIANENTGKERVFACRHTLHVATPHLFSRLHPYFLAACQCTSTSNYHACTVGFFITLLPNRVRLGVQRSGYGTLFPSRNSGKGVVRRFLRSSMYIHT